MHSYNYLLSNFQIKEVSVLILVLMEDALVQAQNKIFTSALDKS